MQRMMSYPGQQGIAGEWTRTRLLNGLGKSNRLKLRRVSVRVADDSLHGRIALFLMGGCAPAHAQSALQIGTAHLDLRPIMLYAQL